MGNIEFLLNNIEEDTTVWRYIDIYQLISMLTDKKLFFSRLDTLNDPSEMTFPALNKKVFSISGMQHRKILYEYIDELKKNSFVNCWHINNAESQAMWRLYLSSYDGVAIKSTVKKICESYLDSAEIKIVKILYLDFNEKDLKNYENGLIYKNGYKYLYMYKDISWEYEKEIRMIYQETPGKKEDIDNDEEYLLNDDNMKYGRAFKFNLDLLIERIVFSPLISDWKIEVIKSIINKYGFKFNNQSSNFSRHQFFESV